MAAKYAFDGTLRRGMSNYDAIRQQAIYLRSEVIHGYQLFSLGEYPYAVRTNSPADTIVVELFSIDNEKTEEIINQLETDAGYILDSVIIAEEKFGIFLFENHNEEDPQIHSGDWVKFVAEFDF